MKRCTMWTSQRKKTLTVILAFSFPILRTSPKENEKIKTENKLKL